MVVCSPSTNLVNMRLKRSSPRGLEEVALAESLARSRSALVLRFLFFGAPSASSSSSASEPSPRPFLCLSPSRRSASSRLTLGRLSLKLGGGVTSTVMSKMMQ